MQPELCDAKPQTGETFHRLVELAFPVTRRAGKVDRLVPKNASPARTDERAIAKGANIRRLSRNAFANGLRTTRSTLSRDSGVPSARPAGAPYQLRSRTGARMWRRTSARTGPWC